jgi:hypothetical protein
MGIVLGDIRCTEGSTRFAPLKIFEESISVQKSHG